MYTSRLPTSLRASLSLIFSYEQRDDLSAAGKPLLQYFVKCSAISTYYANRMVSITILLRNYYSFHYIIHHTKFYSATWNDGDILSDLVHSGFVEWIREYLSVVNEPLLARYRRSLLSIALVGIDAEMLEFLINAGLRIEGDDTGYLEIRAVEHNNARGIETKHANTIGYIHMRLVEILTELRARYPTRVEPKAITNVTKELLSMRFEFMK